MCWDGNIIHHANSHLFDADDWLRLGIDVDVDPLFCTYLQYMMELRKLHAAPMDLLMHLENMPYYHGPQLQP
jgi:hypothetical protein